MNDQYYGDFTRENLQDTREHRRRTQSRSRRYYSATQNTQDLAFGSSEYPTAGSRAQNRLNNASLDQRYHIQFFSDATRDQLKRIGQSIAILVAITLLILMTVATWKGSTMTGDLGLAIFSMTLVTVILFAFSYLTASYISDKSFVFLVLVLVAIALVKLFLVLTYRVGPTSDYWNYHYLAYARASGIPWSRTMVGVNSSWPHVLNIAFLYSIPYSLIGTNFITSQIINIIVTFFDALLIYKLCASIINKQAGIFSALVFSLMPSYFLYSILNGAEPMFLTFVLGLLVTFDTFMRRDENASNARWLISVISMLFLAILAYMVRPTVTIWIVAGLLFLIFRRETIKVSPTLRIKRYMYYFGFFAAFLVFSSLSANIYSSVYGMQIGSNSNLNKYSLATGTSPSTYGAYNKDIYGIMTKNYQKYSNTAEMDQHVDAQLSAQINKNVGRLNRGNHWGQFIDEKYTRFSAEDYGYDWLLYNSYQKNGHVKTFYDMKKPLVAVSVIYFEFILILSILTMSFILLFSPILPNPINLLNKLFYFSLLLDGFIIGSMIFEVQGRYHSILYVPLVMILGLGVQLLTERQHKLNLNLTI